MAHTTIGWFQNVDTGTGLTAITALTDQSIVTNGVDARIPVQFNRLFGVYANGVDLTQAQFSTPSLRQRLLLDVAPAEAAAEPANPYGFTHFEEHPIQLVSGEDARLFVINDGESASDSFGFAFLMDAIDPVPDGAQITTVRCTSATTLTANAWSLCPLTFSQQLNAGRWAVVGARFESAGCQAGRLVFPGAAHRPGAIGRDAIGDVEDRIFRAGGLGIWGSFDNTQPPQAEFCATSADTAEVVYLDLIYLGPATGQA